MSAHKSFLALYGTPNTRGYGPRPPLWILLGIVAFWTAVYQIVFGG